MSALLRILFLAPTGYVLACIAAGWTIAFGVYGLRYDVELMWEVFATGWLMTFYAGWFAFVPAAVAVVLAEAFGWRSALFWMLFGGAVAAVGYEFPFAAGAAPGDNDYRLAFIAAGFVGGFVYWLIAGRLSGNGYSSTSGPPATERTAVPDRTDRP